jgi:ELWxxDGT repeat protein
MIHTTRDPNECSCSENQLKPERRRLARPWVLGILATAGLAAAAGAEPRMVANLNTGPTGEARGALLLGVEHAGITYFQGADPQQGAELWRTDGTPAGTYRLTDVCPGSCDSGASPLAFLSGFLLFAASDGDRGAELWRTDGIPGHETLIKEFCPGRCAVSVDAGIEWNGELWLLVQPAGRGPALWRSDGTADGTRQVVDLCADLGVCGSTRFDSATFEGLTAAGDALLLGVFNGSTDLVRTDGTPRGTAVLHHFGQLLTIVTTGVPTAPVFFVDGSQLWLTDGTPAGTRLVRDLAGLVLTTYLQDWKVIDGVFYAITDDGEWLRSDGTAAGTEVLAIVPSAFRPTVCHLGSVVYAFTTRGLWRTGGTPATTVQVAGFALEDVEVVVEQPDRLFILAWPDLWTSDGTAAGTRRMRIGAGPPPDEYSLTPFLGGAAFARGGHELWQVDSTGRDVALLRDFEPADGASGPLGQIVFEGRLLFFAQTSPSDEQLFASDGTARGTQVVSAAAHDTIDPSYYYSAPPAHLFGSSEAHVYFDAGGRVWASDGSERGTRPIGSYALASSFPIAAIQDRLVFSGSPPAFSWCGVTNTQPWISDGTPEHTHQILELNPYFFSGGGSMCEDLPLSSDPGPGVSLGETILFAADDLVHGRELFATDGTAAGTRLVADINPATKPNDVADPNYPPYPPARIGVGSNPSDFVRSGSGAFFTADDGESGRQLWFSNGERRGTRRVVDRGQEPYDSPPHDLVIYQGDLYFVAAHGAGEGLFRSDGTSAGTVLVDDLTLDGQPTFASMLTATDRSLFFVAFNETTGSELWVSHGSAASTHLVVDLRPGPLGSSPQNLAAVAGVLVFGADDGVSGLEPWRSDGTVAGTFRLGDIAAGAASSNPGPFSVVGEQVLFGADDGLHGRELWSLPLADVRGKAPSVSFLERRRTRKLGLS